MSDETKLDAFKRLRLEGKKHLAVMVEFQIDACRELTFLAEFDKKETYERQIELTEIITKGAESICGIITRLKKIDDALEKIEGGAGE